MLLPTDFIPSSIPTKMSVYNCDGCREDIPEKKARIYCHNCRDNYCANCFVVQKFPAAHKMSHPTMILNVSGVVLDQAPLVMPPRPKASIAARHIAQTYEAPPLLPRTQTAPVLQTGAKWNSSSGETIQVPTANWGALVPAMRGLLKSKKKEPSISEHIPIPAPLPKDLPVSDRSKAGTIEQHKSLPQEVPLPATPMDEEEPIPPPECWEPMFSNDGTPQPIFISLMSELFSSLDSKAEGLLAPEQYSAYLEVQGVDTADNICMFLLHLSSNCVP